MAIDDAPRKSPLQQLKELVDRRGVKIAPKWTAYARDRPNEFFRDAAYNLENIVVAWPQNWKRVLERLRHVAPKRQKPSLRHLPHKRRIAQKLDSWCGEYFDFPMGLRNVEDQKAGPYLEFINEACRISTFGLLEWNHIRPN